MLSIHAKYDRFGLDFGIFNLFNSGGDTTDSIRVKRYLRHCRFLLWRNATLKLTSILRLLSLGLLFASATGLHAQKTFENIETYSDWSSCTVCAGIYGHGTPARYGMVQHQSSPSINDNSSRFWIGSGKPYSDVLWWRQLGPDANAHHFVYELYYYITSPTSPQALEFDVNQSVNGLKYVFSTECDISFRHTWRVWDTKNWRWIDTGVACVVPTAYQWHHLVIQFERTTDNREHYVSVQFDGVTHYWNIYASPRKSGAEELNVAFQEDGNDTQTPYSVWLNKVTLTDW